MPRRTYFPLCGRPANTGRYAIDDDPDDDREPDEAPETPLDEPSPPHVQDPPPEPERKGPYVVHEHF